MQNEQRKIRKECAECSRYRPIDRRRKSEIKAMCRSLRAVCCGIYASAMQRERPAADTVSRLLGYVEYALRGTRSLQKVYNISTLSDLHADRDKNQTEMDRLIDYRRHLQNKIRRATPTEKETLREEKRGVTEQITELRKRLKYAEAIEKRSVHIDDCLNQIHDTLENQRLNQNVRTDRRREELRR